jgi:predicted DNA-binding protein YlxM (UPF0122 family)
MESRKPKDPETQVVEAGLLLDTYGALLTERQRQFMRLHYEEDLSFSEIAREFNISRQAVHDSVKHATAALQQFEATLGLVGKARSAGATGGAAAGAAPGGAPGAETRIAGRQLVERLDALRRRIKGESSVADPSWIVDELSVLITLLQGEKP